MYQIFCITMNIFGFMSTTAPLRKVLPLQILHPSYVPDFTALSPRVARLHEWS